MKFSNRRMMFRLRGFADSSGTEVEIFGNEAAPLNTDGSPMTLIFDQMVDQHTTVTDLLARDAGTIADPQG